MALSFLPLERYLPPLPSGLASSWVSNHALSGEFVLEPFGAAPALIAEAAASGARVIVAANNPISRLLIEITANPPTPEETHAVLAALAASRIRNERLEIHIRSLYLSTCPECNKEIQVEAFLWANDADTPFARLLRCPFCDTAGEFETTEADKQAATKFKAGGLHHARALERVAPISDPDRIHVEEALNVYPPRAVYVLQTIVNRIDALNLAFRESQILGAMLLNVFDQANTLWPYPTERERPRQLTVPPVYRENNIWFALEKAADAWFKSSDQIPISNWPVLPPETGGICLFHRRIKELVEELEDINLAALLMAFPRPNQAFWSLSALWAGWLWGFSAVEHYKSILRRRRFDWSWHTTATQSALENLPRLLPNKTPILGIIGEAEPGLLTAALIAATRAGFALQQLDLDSSKKIAKSIWHSEPDRKKNQILDGALPQPIQNAAQNYLLERGEPSSYFLLDAAIINALASADQFPQANTASECYGQTQQAIQNTLSYQRGFLRFGGSEKSLDVGLWWLSNADKAAIPLADRVEMATVRFLLQNPGCSYAEVEAAISQDFPGLFRPPMEFIIECLNSYGEETEANWRIKPADTAGNRRAELATMQKYIVQIGERLNFSVQSPENDKDPYLWCHQVEGPRFALYLSASALLGKFLIEQHPPPAPGLIIIPGGRSNLIMFKLKRDPRLQQAAADNWRFIKFRQIRQLAASPVLSIDNLETQLGLDPLTYQETQLRMF